MYIHNILQTKKKTRLSQKMGHNKNRKKTAIPSTTLNTFQRNSSEALGEAKINCILLR